jgi:hypothetical protein
MKKSMSLYPGKKNAFEAQANRNIHPSGLKVPIAIMIVMIMIGCSIFVATSFPSSKNASTYVDRSWAMIMSDDPGGKNGLASSIAIDSNHHVHISYQHPSTSALRYATNETGSWVYTMVDGWYSGVSGESTSLAISSNNKVYIATHNDTSGELRVFARTISGSAWSNTLIDNVGDPGDTDASGNPAISAKTDTNNKLHIAYWRHTSNDLVYATNASGGWVITAVDTVGNVGDYCSLDLDSGNKAHISYWNSTAIHLSYATNVGGSWVHANLDNSSNNGYMTSLVVDTSNKVHIVYTGGGPGPLSYITNSGGSWSSPVAIAPGGSGTYTYGGRPSLAIDNSNNLHVAHEAQSGSPFDWNLMYTTNENGTWDTHLVDSYQQVGYGPSIAVDTDGKVLIATHDNDAAGWDLRLYSSMIVIPEFGSVALVSIFAAVIVLAVMQSRRKTD